MSGSELTGTLPYGPEFHFVDRVVSHTPDGRIVTEKVFRATDAILRAHFAGGPAIVPGLVLAEMASQSALLWALITGRIASDTRLLLGSIKATFHRPARADCTVTAQVMVENPAGGFAFKGELCDGEHTLAKVHGVGMVVPSPESS